MVLCVVAGEAVDDSTAVWGMEFGVWDFGFCRSLGGLGKIGEVWGLGVWGLEFCGVCGNRGDLGRWGLARFGGCGLRFLFKAHTCVFDQGHRPQTRNKPQIYVLNPPGDAYMVDELIKTGCNSCATCDRHGHKKMTALHCKKSGPRGLKGTSLLSLRSLLPVIQVEGSR